MCVMGQHGECHDSQCRCLCHKAAQELMKKSQSVVQRTSAALAGSALVCSEPGCTRIPRPGDRYCRDDGTKLIAGRLCQCGHAGEIGDSYCPFCGKKFGLEAVVESELSETEIAAIEARARQRPSDVETPPIEVQ
jgi:hypothetical protein